jgi:hypothetical protein
VLVAPLGGWLVTLPLLSAFAFLLMLVHYEFSGENLAPSPTSILQSRFSIPPPPLMIFFRLQFAVYVFQFCWQGFSLSRGFNGLFSWGVVRGVAHGV